MTMVPTPKLSKPHYFYGACGGASDVMTRFTDGCAAAGAGAGAGAGYGGYNNNNIINGGGGNGDGDASITANNNNNITIANSTSNNDDLHKVDNHDNVNSCVLGSDLGIGHPNYSNYHNISVMAEEQQSRTSNTTSVNDDGDDLYHQPTAAAAAATAVSCYSPLLTLDHHHHRIGSSSSWLQLGLGDGTHSHLKTSFSGQEHPAQDESTGGGRLMLELNLGGGGSGSGSESRMIHQTTPLMPEFESRVPQRPLDFPTSNLFGGVGSISGGTTFLSTHPMIPLFFPSSQSQLPPQPHHHHMQHQPLHQQLLLSDNHYQHQQQQQQQKIGWGFANHRTTFSAAVAACSSSLSPSSSSSMPSAVPGQGGAGSFLTRPFTLTGSSLDAADSEFRLIHPPPRRLHSGIWFNLQASPHQSKQPFLPQVSKNFLRIKDGRMTVRLVMKYLANKLGLNSESEVEIRCRGQQVETFLTLQYVRDNIWIRRDVAVTLLPDSSTSDHVMVLNYGRSTITTTTISSTYLPN